MRPLTRPLTGVRHVHTLVDVVCIAINRAVLWRATAGFVRGLAGNAAVLLPAIRNGVLVHTGAWGNYSSWTPKEPMPNSDGCVHAHPEAIHAIWRLLVERCGVEVRPNSGGKRPYPYKPQGLVAVFEV